MFKGAEIGNSVPKEEYDKEEPRLRMALLQAQKALAASDKALLVLVSGVEGAGKGETVDLLHAWMDARGMETHAFWDTTDEERERPPMWRFWRALPARGRIGVFFGSWYTAPVIDRVFRRSRKIDVESALGRILGLERMLTSEGIILVKLWFHLSKKRQKKRLETLEADPDLKFRVTKMDWKFFAEYDRFRAVSERVIQTTSTGEAPWHIVEGADPRYRNLTVGRILLEAMTSHIAAPGHASNQVKEKASDQGAEHGPALDLPEARSENVIQALDLTRVLPEKAYEKRLSRLTAEIGLGSRRLRHNGNSLIVVFEGPDAAGKGGAIRRITAAMDARLYRVTSVAAPTDEEHARPYLWRFWRPLPRRGRVTIYDRSWYGRVLVERIEGFCAKEDWRRAYAEINAFEEQLSESGTKVVKFWIAISPEEQLRRFEDRALTPYKQYKLTAEDWRNRTKWSAYEAAACDMIEKTSTQAAPWVLVEGNDKNWARIQVLKAVAKALAD